MPEEDERRQADEEECDHGEDVGAGGRHVDGGIVDTCEVGLERVERLPHIGFIRTVAISTKRLSFALMSTKYAV